jgi:hypothetical protein
VKWGRPSLFVACRAVGLLATAYLVLQLRAQSPEQNKPLLQLIFEGGTGEMTSQPSGSAAGIAFHFEDSLPTFGRLVVNQESLGNDGVFRTGEDYAKLQGAKWNHFSFGVTAGDFRASSNLLEPMFANLFLPEMAARGFYAEAVNKDAKYVFFAGSETLPLVPVNFFRVGAPQNVVGMSAQREFRKKWRVGARILHLSSDEHQIAISPFLFMLPPERRFRRASTGLVQSTYSIGKHLRLFGEGNVSSAERIVPVQNSPAAAEPVSAASGIAWESPKLMLKANYVDQSLSYLPFTGYFLGDRRGPSAEARYKIGKRVELTGNTAQYLNNLEHDPARPLVESDSSTVGATLNLPSKLTAGAQTIVIGTTVTYPGQAPSYLGNRLSTVSIVRPLRQHNLKVSLRQVVWVATGNHPLTVVWPEVEDTFNSKRITAVAAVRLQRQALWLPETPAFRGAIDVRLSRLTAHADIDSSNLQPSTIQSSNAIRNITLRATARIGKGWNCEIQSSRMRLTSLPNLVSPNAPDPEPLLLYEQGAMLVRFTKQFKMGGRL